MLRAAGMDRAHSRNWQRPACLGPREGGGGPLRPWEGTLLLELWEAIAGFTAGADMTGWSADWSHKVDVGRPERKQLQLSRQMGYLI